MTQSENFTVVFIRSLTANLFSNRLLIYGALWRPFIAGIVQG